VHVVVQPAIYASAGTAGLVMPVPARADVHSAPVGIIGGVRNLMTHTEDGSPAVVRETVTFVEDRTLGGQCTDPHYSARQRRTPRMAWTFPSPLMLMGCSSEDYYRPDLEEMDTDVIDYGPGEGEAPIGRVEVEEIEVSEDYTVSVLNASSIAALTRWMDDNGFAHDDVDDTAFAHYVGDGNWFVAVEVHPSSESGERVDLAPLVVSYRGDEVPITHELTYDPAGGIIETDMFVLAPSKRVAEDDDAAILRYAAPFSLAADVGPVAALGLREGWLTRLHFERNMSDAHKRDTRLVDGDEEMRGLPAALEKETRVYVASGCCADNSVPSAARTFTRERTYPVGTEPDDEFYFFRVPPRDDGSCDGRGGPWTGASVVPPPRTGAPDAGGAGFGDGDYEYGSDDDGGYACSVAGAAVSWSPVLLAVAICVQRRRKKRS